MHCPVNSGLAQSQGRRILGMIIKSNSIEPCDHAYVLKFYIVVCVCIFGMTMKWSKTSCMVVKCAHVVSTHVVSTHALSRPYMAVDAERP